MTSELAAKLARRDALQSPHPAGQVALVREAGHQRHLGQRRGVGLDQDARPRQASLDDIAVRWLAEAAAKQGAEVRNADA